MSICIFLIILFILYLIHGYTNIEGFNIGIEDENKFISISKGLSLLNKYDDPGGYCDCKISRYFPDGSYLCQDFFKKISDDRTQYKNRKSSLCTHQTYETCGKVDNYGGNTFNREMCEWILD